MLSRRKDLRGKRNDDDDDQKPSSSSQVSRTNATSSTSSTRRDQKRKADSDPHDTEGSEYLRRKHKFIKSTILVDYQPDICKDYKETGFCGFGDSCKFLHDRSDYKHGWQLEQEYAKGQYKDEDDDKYLIKESDEEDEEDESKCKICNEIFQGTKVTMLKTCKHYFCDPCAEKQCIEKCFICQKPTSGIFKTVTLDSVRKKR